MQQQVSIPQLIRFKGVQQRLDNKENLFSRRMCKKECEYVSLYIKQLLVFGEPKQRRFLSHILSMYEAGQIQLIPIINSEILETLPEEIRFTEPLIKIRPKNTSKYEFVNQVLPEEIASSVPIDFNFTPFEAKNSSLTLYLGIRSEDDPLCPPAGCLHPMIIIQNTQQERFVALGVERKETFNWQVAH